MDYGFYALVSRMKNINRWALMRNSFTENVQEHSHMTAVLAHALAVIARDVYGKKADPDKCAAAALFHDASEIITGDMPTPVKYYSSEITSAYKSVEDIAVSRLVSALPEEMRPSYSELMNPEGDVKRYVKAADTLSAYIKCLEELKAGNEEFRRASEQSVRKLEAMEMPEVSYFLENFMPAFMLTLDEINF
ncbi:MAG: 5'-deoxynucleotidase [Oscillospiraceae bacterium]|nr:5'-deoxynucleotidase [Oscillospiraceae bacterium]